MLSVANGISGIWETEIQVFSCRIWDFVWHVFALVIYCETKLRNKGLFVTNT